MPAPYHFGIFVKLERKRKKMMAEKVFHPPPPHLVLHPGGGAGQGVGVFLEAPERVEAGAKNVLPRHLYRSRCQEVAGAPLKWDRLRRDVTRGPAAVVR